MQMMCERSIFWTYKRTIVISFFLEKATYYIRYNKACKKYIFVKETVE